MSEAETQVGSEGGVDGAVRGAEAKDELPGAETALGSAGEENEGVKEDNCRGLDTAAGTAGEADVLHNGRAGEGLALQGRVLEAIEEDHSGRSATIRFGADGDRPMPR